MSTVLVHGNVLSFVGNQLGKRNTFNTGTVRLALVMPPRSNQVPIDVGAGRPAQVHYDVPVAWNGEFKAQVLSNDSIRPSGTVYSLVFMVPNVNVVPKFYCFDGAGPFNLNTMTPVTEADVHRRQTEEIKHDITKVEEKLKVAGSINDRLARLRKLASDLDRQIKDLEVESQSNGATERQLADLNNQLRELQLQADSLGPLRQQQAELQRRVTDFQSQLEKM